MILLVHNSPKTVTSVIIRRFSALLGVARESFVCLTYSELFQNPETIHSYTHIILAGGSLQRQRHGRSEMAAFIEILKEYNGKVLGICYGAQLMARAYGAYLAKMPERIDGIRKVHLLSDIAKKLERYTIEVFKRQEWSMQGVNSDLMVLAVSDSGVEAFMTKQGDWIGLSFHPEIFIHHHDGARYARALCAEYGFSYSEA